MQIKRTPPLEKTPTFNGETAYEEFELLHHVITGVDLDYKLLKKCHYDADPNWEIDRDDFLWGVHSARSAYVFGAVLQLMKGAEDDNAEIIFPSGGDKDLFHEHVCEMTQKLVDDLAEMHDHDILVPQQYADEIAVITQIVPAILRAPRAKRPLYAFSESLCHSTNKISILTETSSPASSDDYATLLKLISNN